MSRNAPTRQGGPQPTRSGGAGRTSGRTSGRGSGSASRSAAGAKQPVLWVGAPRYTTVLGVLLGPVVAVLIGKFIGGYYGPVFALLTVAAACAAAAAATKDALWFVFPGVPPVIWLVGTAAELSWHNPPYQGSKAQAVGLVHATTHVFPVIAAALILMALVVVAGRYLERQKGAGHV